MKLLRGLVDLYLSDWKYWDNNCAQRLSDAGDYLRIIKRNHRQASKDAELVIRHLVMPNHFECCTRPILEHIAENFGERVVVNIMGQYRPEYKAGKHKDINRTLRAVELRKATELAERLGLCFII
ncbi:hypothetical protein KY320_02375 [Candidatus Woesearchaeota archaeon]|nr:hypothetical protein [Candidatus Woesearchaeota archaeon]